MRTLEGSWVRRWVWLCATLAGIAVQSPASAYTFVLTSGGSDEYLTWMWSWTSPFNSGSCLTSSSNPCPTIFSANGNIELQAYRATSLGVLAGGSLTWTTQPGALKLVAMPTVYAKALQNGYSSDVWAAVDARTNPLVFEIVPQAGDPVPLLPSLQIVPKLVGNISQFTNPGTLTSLDFRATMAVAVNGQTVSADTLSALFGTANGPDTVWAPTFPRGAANDVFLSGLAAGSQISIAVWVYMRGYASSSNNTFCTLDAASAYGEGPAVEIQVRDANAVAVPEEGPPTGLRLAFHPNPARGVVRISYALPRASDVRLAVYDLHGGRVATLADRAEEAGRSEITWDGRGAHGRRLSPGVYVVELVSGHERTVGKLLLIGRSR